MPRKSTRLTIRRGDVLHVPFGSPKHDACDRWLVINSRVVVQMWSHRSTTYLMTTEIPFLWSHYVGVHRESDEAKLDANTSWRFEPLP